MRTPVEARCDRCGVVTGNVYIDFNHPIRHGYNFNTTDVYDFEICKSCMIELEHWLLHKWRTEQAKKK